MEETFVLIAIICLGASMAFLATISQQSCHFFLYPSAELLGLAAQHVPNTTGGNRVLAAG